MCRSRRSVGGAPDELLISSGPPPSLREITLFMWLLCVACVSMCKRCRQIWHRPSGSVALLEVATIRTLRAAGLVDQPLRLARIEA